MSIALAAVIVPSRLLRLALFAYAAACILAAVLLAGPQAARFHAPRAAALLCLAGALGAARAAPATTRRIDISGPGALRVLVQHSMAGAAPVLRLEPGCTVWPALIVLLLRDEEHGRTSVLTILPDSVPAWQFRNIAVAIRTIARRDNSLRKTKIR